MPNKIDAQICEHAPNEIFNSADRCKLQAIYGSRHVRQLHSNHMRLGLLSLSELVLKKVWPKVTALTLAHRVWLGLAEGQGADLRLPVTRVGGRGGWQPGSRRVDRLIAQLVGGLASASPPTPDVFLIEGGDD